MRIGSLFRHKASEPVIGRAWKAEKSLDRMRGLLGRPALAPGEAMVIDPCSSVHTMGMAYALDIAFIDSGEKIVKLCRRVAPQRMAWAFKARATVEMAAGEIDRLQLSVGDRLEWRTE